MKNQLSTFDVVQEFCASVETWIQTVRPSIAKLSKMLDQISAFMAEYSLRVDPQPPFLRVPVDTVQLRDSYGVSFYKHVGGNKSGPSVSSFNKRIEQGGGVGEESADEGGAVAAVALVASSASGGPANASSEHVAAAMAGDIMANPHNVANMPPDDHLYYFKRWMWTMYPLLALQNFSSRASIREDIFNGKLASGKLFSLATSTKNSVDEIDNSGSKRFDGTTATGSYSSPTHRLKLYSAPPETRFTEPKKREKSNPKGKTLPSDVGEEMRTLITVCYDYRNELEESWKSIEKQESRSDDLTNQLSTASMLLGMRKVNPQFNGADLSAILKVTGLGGSGASRVMEDGGYIDGMLSTDGGGPASSLGETDPFSLVPYLELMKRLMRIERQMRSFNLRKQDPMRQSSLKLSDTRKNATIRNSMTSSKSLEALDNVTRHFSESGELAEIKRTMTCARYMLTVAEEMELNKGKPFSKPSLKSIRTNTHFPSITQMFKEKAEKKQVLSLNSIYCTYRRTVLAPTLSAAVTLIPAQTLTIYLCRRRTSLGE